MKHNLTFPSVLFKLVAFLPLGLLKFIFWLYKFRPVLYRLSSLFLRRLMREKVVVLVDVL